MTRILKFGYRKSEAGPQCVPFPTPTAAVPNSTPDNLSAARGITNALLFSALVWVLVWGVCHLGGRP